MLFRHLAPYIHLAGGSGDFQKNNETGVSTSFTPFTPFTSFTSVNSFAELSGRLLNNPGQKNEYYFHGALLSSSFHGDGLSSSSKLVTR